MANVPDPLPPLLPANPGDGAYLHFEDAQGNVTSTLSLPDLLAEILRSLEVACEVHGAAVWLPESELLLLPHIVDLRMAEHVNTVTTIQCHHATRFPAGVFEYQHAAQHEPLAAFRQGFEGWARGDLPALLDTLAAEPDRCTRMEMDVPATDETPARTRRVILGPVSYYGTQVREENGQTHEPFCPCCLLTNTFRAFETHLKGSDLFALRLFAMRDSQGEVHADCRINGEDFEPGAEALRTYVGTWPGTEFEFRKQYVVIFNQPTE